MDRDECRSNFNRAGTKNNYLHIRASCTAVAVTETDLGIYTVTYSSFALNKLSSSHPTINKLGIFEGLKSLQFAMMIASLLDQQHKNQLETANWQSQFMRFRHNIRYPRYKELHDLEKCQWVHCTDKSDSPLTKHNATENSFKKLFRKKTERANNHEQSHISMQINTDFKS